VQVERVSGALGADVSGVDLSRDISNSEAAAIHAAFLEHKVLFFHEQELSPQQQVRFTRIFGEPGIYPFIEGLPEAPEVIEILKTEKDTVNFGGSWHSDTAYLPEPSLGSVLYALEVPDAGGDTLFANTALAYEALSGGMQQMLAGLVGVNSSESLYRGGRAAAMARLDGMKDNFKTEAEVYVSEHPVVRSHPETGVKSLYLSQSHTRGFKDMTAAESQPLIDYLSAHMVRPEFTCRFRWRPGSLAVWDNRITMHNALNDYQGKRRRMHRVTIEGDRPF